MNQQEASKFIAYHSKYFPSNHQDELWRCLSSTSFENTAEIEPIFNQTCKNPVTAELLAVFFGMYGVDRFYLNDVGMGILKLFTFGGFFFVYLFDCFATLSRCRNSNFIAFRERILNEDIMNREKLRKIDEQMRLLDIQLKISKLREQGYEQGADELQSQYDAVQQEMWDYNDRRELERKMERSHDELMKKLDEQNELMERQLKYQKERDLQEELERSVWRNQF